MTTPLDPTALTTDAVNSARDHTDREISHLKELMDRQFTLIERQRVEQKEDTEKAVQAALNAAKEAVKEQTAASQMSINKSEEGVKDQLRQQNTTFTTANEGVNREVNALTTRVERIENVKQGSQENKAATYTLAGMAILVLGLLGTIVAIVISLK